MERPLEAAQPSHTERSIATIGVLLRKAEHRATGTHSRSTPAPVERGAPSSGSSSISTARVSSSARATTKSTPMTRTEGEATPRHASAFEMMPESSSTVVVPSSTISGGCSLTISSRDARTSHTVAHESARRQRPAWEPVVAQMGWANAPSPTITPVPSRRMRRER
eukprot:scaffold124958_cov23-Tisochrysis_lutea.AAC.2